MTDSPIQMPNSLPSSSSRTPQAASPLSPAMTSGEPYTGSSLGTSAARDSLKNGPFQESWYLSLRDPSSLRALDLRFNVLISNNGFRRLAEAWGVFFQKNPGRDTSKIALKETFDLGRFSTALNREGFQVADCEVGPTFTRGKIQSKGQMIEWDLTMEPRQSAAFDLVPRVLKRTGLIRNQITTPQPDLSVNGVVRVNGQEHRFTQAPGMQGLESGTKGRHSWISGHCNVFTNEQGVPVPFVFEGTSMRSQLLAGIPSPKVSSFFFLYKGRQHYFNSIRDVVRLRSRYTLKDWIFQAERGDLLFRGRATIEHKDFAGLTFEDTNGSLIYCATSKFSTLEVQVYNRGKLESALRADQSASIEISSRKKNPYVPLLI